MLLLDSKWMQLGNTDFLYFESVVPYLNFTTAAPDYLWSD